MYITNDPKIAQIAERSGVDWIFIDLEIKGKIERQGHLDTVISNHKTSDIKPIKKVLSKSKLLVRVNPIHRDSVKEIDEVIKEGAEIIMLPYFKTKQEVEDFIKIVNKRIMTCILLETPEAVENLDDILQVKGIDYIHIGLNDLHLGYNMKFMFELLSNGTVEKIINKIQNYNLPYGFGGIAQIGQGSLPAEKIIAEHYRLKSSMVILSRSFFNQNNIKDYDTALRSFNDGIIQIRTFEQSLELKTDDFLETNKREVINIVSKIVSR